MTAIGEGGMTTGTAEKYVVIEIWPGAQKEIKDVTERIVVGIVVGVQIDIVEMMTEGGEIESVTDETVIAMKMIEIEIVETAKIGSGGMIEVGNDVAVMGVAAKVIPTGTNNDARNPVDAMTETANGPKSPPVKRTTAATIYCG
jgi:hypothetical protein